ncbi:MAG: nucleotidyltransferase domain-containing protein [Bacteroidetes bacterium]|nr:nucleotidyltransferase domain-containing protein [Bacteroidota bacterium]
MVKESIITIVKKYLTELQKAGLQVSRAIIYGSNVRGEAREDSDIDLLLVSPIFDSDTDKYAGLIWRLTEVSNFKIEPIAVGEKRFAEDDVSVILEVARREGIEIVI